VSDQASSRPEIAFVLMLLQATFWFAAGVSAFPFVLGGEPFMAAAGAASFALAAATAGLAIGVVQRRKRARRWTIVLEFVCLGGAVLQQVLPIGSNHGPVALLVNLALPAAVALLLWNNCARAAVGLR
jgi:hypothetical protein